MPLRFAAELLGMDSDNERAIRWLIALLVCCLDPMALALTASVSARQAWRGLARLGCNHASAGCSTGDAGIARMLHWRRRDII